MRCLTRPRRLTRHGCDCAGPCPGGSRRNRRITEPIAGDRVPQSSRRVLTTTATVGSRDPARHEDCDHSTIGSGAPGTRCSPERGEGPSAMADAVAYIQTVAPVWRSSGGPGDGYHSLRRRRRVAIHGNRAANSLLDRTRRSLPRTPGNRWQHPAEPDQPDRLCRQAISTVAPYGLVGSIWWSIRLLET